MTLVAHKSGDGSVNPEDFNAVVDAVVALQAGGGGSQPAGDTGQIQYNDADALAASPDFVWDDAEHQLKLAATANGLAEIIGGAPGAQLFLSGADGDETHVGGELTLRSGDSAGQSGGGLFIKAGNDAADGDGGSITIDGGQTLDGEGGEIAITAGASTNGDGGRIYITGGAGGGGHVTIAPGGPNGQLRLFSADSVHSVTLSNGGLEIGATALGFYQAAAVPQPTGVAVTAEAIHAALVTLGLIAA